VASNSQGLKFLKYAFGKRKKEKEKEKEKGQRQTGGVYSSVKDHEPC
jgi:hypothetical protein